jgi:hypothetical protein
MYRKYRKSYLIVGLFLFLNLGIAAQIKLVKNEIPQPSPQPSKEEFKEDDGIVDMSTRTATKMYYEVTFNEIARLYNSDGSVWWEFSYNKESPLFYEKIMKPEVIFFDYKSVLTPKFRVKTSSKNWYEVVIDDAKGESGTTKFVSKTDEALGYITFVNFLKRNSFDVELDKEKNPPRETPGGEVIKDDEFDPRDGFFILEGDGDWLKISGSFSRRIGRIRWREKRKVLIKF